MQDKPKVLIVEDSQPQRERCAKILNQPSQEWLKDIRIKGFQVDTAATVVAANKQLKDAFRQKKAYEAVLLDIHLPRTTKDLERGRIFEQQGLRLLEQIRKKYDCAVVIITAYPNNKKFVHAIQQSAVDFLLSPLQTREEEKYLFLRMLMAVGSTREKMYLKQERHRAQLLTYQYEKRMYQHLSRKITDLTTQISYRHENLATMLSNRFDIDFQRDAQDPIGTNWQHIQKDLKQLTEIVWQGVSKQEKNIEFKEIDLNSTIEGVVSYLHPCYYHRKKNLILKINGSLRTLSIESDLRDMLNELIFNGLISSVGNNPVELDAKLGADGKDIVIIIRYYGKPISDHVLGSLQRGEFLGNNLNDWEYSFICLHEIGRNIGIRTDFKRDGRVNQIRLFIPVLSHE